MKNEAHRDRVSCRTLYAHQALILRIFLWLSTQLLTSALTEGSNEADTLGNFDNQSCPMALATTHRLTFLAFLDQDEREMLNWHSQLLTKYHPTKAFSLGNPEVVSASITSKLTKLNTLKPQIFFLRLSLSISFQHYLEDIWICFIWLDYRGLAHTLFLKALSII